MTTHANPWGAVTTRVILANTQHNHMFWSLRQPFFFLSWDRAAPSPVDWFWRSIRHMTCLHARMCLLVVLLLPLPVQGSNPPKPLFLGINRLFQAQCAKYCNLHIIKHTVSIRTKFCTTQKTTKCSLWVVQIKMADGPPCWKNVKSAYLHNCLTDFDEIWHGDAHWILDP